MAKTLSSMLPLGTPMPAFSLKDTLTGKAWDTRTMLKADQPSVVFFICNHCPYVVHIREKLIEVARNYLIKGVQFLAISSNDSIAYPDDNPEAMAQWAQSVNLPFPYLFDETQDVARSFEAACTPECYVFEKNLLVYRGQFDDSRPSNGQPVTGNHLKDALDKILAGQKPDEHQIPSMGCNIKWKKSDTEASGKK